METGMDGLIFILYKTMNKTIF